ncbi:adrenodoxin, mitochondrial-like [Eublepharis macularius]|uniref:Adrenodoxin, mitochondrial-like n=1 Tax=Eublepharis macularius TaxID=481883 RepID=A0AA97KC42_EUBMA|nr:adrenodoxin, mitochondrial-like [Eublepharis macularius]
MLAQCCFGLSRLLLNRSGVHRAWALGAFGRVSTHPKRGFGYTRRLQDAPGDAGSTDKVTIHFINRDGEKFSAAAKEGDSLLQVVVNQNLSIDGFGACEGALACSTCHLIFDDHTFQQLDPATAEELDMLDLAYGLTDTSRLGCQVHVKKWMDGLTVQVPMEVSDIRRELEVEKQNKQ